MRRSAGTASAAHHPEAFARFQQGCESVFRQWTVLELAVHNEWGGPASAAKAGKLVGEVMELFQSPERIYKDDVALVLEDFMETEFNAVCEDGSPDEIGEVLAQMFRACCAGDFSMVERTLHNERVRADSGKRNSVGIDRGDAVLSDDEDEDGRVDGAQENMLLEAIAEGAEGGEDGGMDVEAPELIPAPRVPIVDEDGFETVVRRSKRLQGKPK